MEQTWEQSEPHKKSLGASEAERIVHRADSTRLPQPLPPPHTIRPGTGGMGGRGRKQEEETGKAELRYCMFPLLVPKPP